MKKKKVFFLFSPCHCWPSPRTTRARQGRTEPRPPLHRVVPHVTRLDVSAKPKSCEQCLRSSILGQCGSGAGSGCSRPKSMCRIYADPDPEHWLRIRCHPHRLDVSAKHSVCGQCFRIQHFRSMRIRIQPTKINADLCRSGSGTLAADP